MYLAFFIWQLRSLSWITGFWALHSNLDLGAVNLGVYLDLVAKSLLTEILLIKDSRFKRFMEFGNPKNLDLVAENWQKVVFWKLNGRHISNEIKILDQKSITLLGISIKNSQDARFLAYFRAFQTYLIVAFSKFEPFLHISVQCWISIR